MAYRKRQYHPESSSENLSEDYPRSYSRTTSGRFMYGQGGNNQGSRKNPQFPKNPDVYWIYDRIVVQSHCPSRIFDG